MAVKRIFDWFSKLNVNLVHDEHQLMSVCERV